MRREMSFDDRCYGEWSNFLSLGFVPQPNIHGCSPYRWSDARPPLWILPNRSFVFSLTSEHLLLPIYIVLFEVSTNLG
jgi:hypothetical protein